MQNLNYEGLRHLFRFYNGSGLRILAFPSNQFGGQAPASDECERAFVYTKMGLPYGAFPVFDKVDVNGPKALPAYRFLKSSQRLPLCAGCEIAWNYEKFLLNSSGHAIARYESGTSPAAAEEKIRELLKLL